MKNMIKKTVFLLSLVFSWGVAVAQNSEPIQVIFENMVSKGVDGIEVKAENVSRSIMDAPVGKGVWKSYKADRSIRFPFHVPLLGNNPNFLAVMRFFSDSMRDACLASGGMLNKGPASPLKNVPHDQKTAARQSIAELAKNDLYGDYTCVADGKILFFVKVVPQVDAEPTLIPPGFNWGVYADLLSGSQVGSAESDSGEFAQGIASGANVAIRASDLPVALRPRMKIYSDYISDNSYRVCAMVVDLKGELVQVQVGTALVFVQRSKLLPAGRPVATGPDISSQQQGTQATGGRDGWCASP